MSNECLICGTECVGITCSGACRAKLSRRTRTQESQAHVPEAHAQQAHAAELPVIGPIETAAVIQPGSLRDYLDDQESNGGRYAHRTAPELLNWGESMTADELSRYKAKHKLKSYHNRTAIPGDWDYTGCCELVDGQWQVKTL